MDEDYYSYTLKCFKFWAPFYDLVDIVISGIRDKVADVTSAKKESKILDVCTGTGKQAFAFGKYGYDVIGIDLSENMLKVANKKNRYENVRFEVADVTDIPFERNYFDVSCISFALHDMPLDIKRKVLEEAVRVTKPKGNVIIVDYALPKNKISRYLCYHFVKLYESKYYPGFIRSDLEDLTEKYKLELLKRHSVMLGCVRILKYKKL